MPIEVAAPIRVLQQDEFHELNHRVLGIIFEIHNEFGRFLDELLFKREIAARCEAAGILPAQREVRIHVSHETFHKSYSLDLLLGHGLPMEAKMAEALAPKHRAQGLNYLLLAGVRHGSLVNLRPERVQHEFVSTSLTPETRRQFVVADQDWSDLDQESVWLKKKTIGLLEDWGAFLEIDLYREAIIHFLGGADTVMKPILVHSGERLVGQQCVALLNEQTAFCFTAKTGDCAKVEEHHRRFLRHTPLRALQWINLNHHRLEFITLQNH